jgi:putative transposase
MTTAARGRYAGHRFPPEIISHAVWLYFRFPLSLRMVEEMLAARGILVSRHRQLVGRDQQCSLVQPANRAISCRGGYAADLCPDLKGTGPGFSILGGGEVIATEMKEVVDRVVG